MRVQLGKLPNARLLIQSLDSVQFLESYRTLNPLGGSGTADSVLPCDRFTGC